MTEQRDMFPAEVVLRKRSHKWLIISWTLVVVCGLLFGLSLTGHIRATCQKATDIEPNGRYDYICAIAFKK